MSDLELDHLVTAAARRMTAADTPPLYAAVESRLRPRRSMTLRRGLPIAAVLAVLAIAIVSSRSAHAPTLVEPAASVATVAARPAPPEAPGEPAIVPTGARQVAAPPADAAVDTTRDLAALPPIDAIAVRDITPAPIQPNTLVVPQLTVAPLAPPAPIVLPALGDIDR